MKPPLTRLMAAFRAHILLLIFLCDVGTLRSFLGSPGNEHSFLSTVSLVCMPFPRKAALALRSTTSGLLPPSAARFEFPGDNQARALPARPPARPHPSKTGFVLSMRPLLRGGVNGAPARTPERCRRFQVRIGMARHPARPRVSVMK